jgi:hypothetical protein
MRAIGSCALTLLALGLTGCGGAEEKLAPVGGTLTTSGGPVPGGNVTFYPDAAKGNTTAHQPAGLIAADGTFELFVPGGRKGAPPGWYKVVVYAVDDPQPGKPNRYFTHKKYSDPATTPLSVEVVAAPAPGRYDFKLDR